MPFPAVNPALERALAARDYAEPTPVQLAVLTPETGGRDMLVSAQTGSGKTVAFGLALAPALLGDTERFDRAAEPLALIIAPTRELALQVQRELAWLYAETGARIATCVGGMDPRAERDALGAGAHVVVGTPGRLRDHLERRRLVLSSLRAVVLDEADEMLDLGFRDDLQFILDATPAERQTLMFSATVPREIESLARSYQRDAMRIATAVRNQQHDDIEYRAVRTVPNAIEPTVVNLLRFYDAPATLVFCATRQGVRRLHAGLANRGFSAVALSGELSQAERTEALDQLRNGRAKVLVATDVAARGLDLAELSLVIHADLPNDRETLLHRSGRTGRAGRKGISVLVVPPNKRRRAEELLGRSRINAVWANAPTLKEIAQKDHERLMAMPILDELATAEDLELGRLLLDGRTPEQVAAALVRMVRAALPVPEPLKDLGRPAPADRARPERPAYERAAPHAARSETDRASRAERARPSRDGGSTERKLTEKRPYERSSDRTDERRRDDEARPAARTDLQRDERRTPRPGPERPPETRSRKEQREMVWFGLNIGRTKNADPRWLLPLICRVGEISKREIGTIRVDETESRFEILAEHADNFANAVRLSKHREGRIWRIDEMGDQRAGDQRADDATPNERVQRPWREAREERGPRPLRKASHAGDRSKPNGREISRDNRHGPPNGAASGGNGTLKRSLKDKKRKP